MKRSRFIAFLLVTATAWADELPCKLPAAPSETPSLAEVAQGFRGFLSDRPHVRFKVHVVTESDDPDAGHVRTEQDLVGVILKPRFFRIDSVDGKKGIYRGNGEYIWQYSDNRRRFYRMDYAEEIKGLADSDQHCQSGYYCLIHLFLNPDLRQEMDSLVRRSRLAPRETINGHLCQVVATEINTPDSAVKRLLYLSEGKSAPLRTTWSYKNSGGSQGTVTHDFTWMEPGEPPTEALFDIEKKEGTVIDMKEFMKGVRNPEGMLLAADTKAPEIAMRDLDGREVALSGFPPDQVVILNFWGVT